MIREGEKRETLLAFALLPELFCSAPPPPAVIDRNCEWKQVFPLTGCFLGICLNSEKANVIQPPFLDPSCPQGNLRMVSLS